MRGTVRSSMMNSEPVMDVARSTRRHRAAARDRTRQIASPVSANLLKTGAGSKGLSPQWS
jgi:hypothetical protein